MTREGDLQVGFHNRLPGGEISQADQVQTVDDALEEFPGRIERDEWVPQAKDLIQRFPDRADRPTRETFLNRSEG